MPAPISTALNSLLRACARRRSRRGQASDANGIFAAKPQVSIEDRQPDAPRPLRAPIYGQPRLSRGRLYEQRLCADCSASTETLYAINRAATH
jgi:hypothetical protein